MRYFNTSGPCDPEKHYTVMRKALLATGQAMVIGGKYFTIFAPRQSGKTTYFQLLIRQLAADRTFTPLWISFENLKTATREEFYNSLTRQMRRYLVKYGIEADMTIASQLDLEIFFEELRSQAPKLVLIVDEFEGIPDRVSDEFMHTLRKLYHQKEFHSLHSVLLVGVQHTRRAGVLLSLTL